MEKLLITFADGEIFTIIPAPTSGGWASGISFLVATKDDAILMFGGLGYDTTQIEEFEP